MVSVRRRAMGAVVAVASCAALIVVSPSTTHATSSSTKVTGKIVGRTNGRILAILPSGSSSFASIKSDSTFSLTLPRSSASSLKVSLHVVNADGSYSGPISLGKKKTRTSANYTWYGAVSFAKGRTTALPTITWSTFSRFGYVKLSRTSTLSLGNTLKKVNVSTGKPAGAGRLGLSTTRAARATSIGGLSSFAVRIFDTNTDAGDDLDGDGLPNSLDIDDDGDGYPDPVDPSSGSKGSTPTAIYDALGNLETGISDAGNRVHAPINYNFLKVAYTDPTALMSELSLLDDANFYLGIRAVAPFFSDDGSKRMKDAWVDCTGLSWCLPDDLNQTDLATYVAAPRLFPVGDGKIEDLWKYAFTNHPGSACDVHIPSKFTTNPSENNCKPVKWGGFSMRNFLLDAQANGSPLVTQDVLDWTTSHTGGFGLYDPQVLTPNTGGKGVNERGFDMGATIKPRGYSKFLDNLTVGDVFYVNATLSDGSVARIAMTIPPIFQTAPTIFSFRAQGDSEATLVDYVTPATCNSMGDPGCRYGDGRNPVMVSSSTPTLTMKFWRPQRLKVAETDTIDSPFIDIGGLNYGVSVQDGSTNTWYRCNRSNSAVAFTDTDNSTFTFVASGGMSNESEWMRDPTADAEPDGGTNADGGRFITLVLSLDKCSKFMGSGPATLNVSDTSTRFNVNLVAASEPKFGGNRSVTQQGFELKFK